MSLAEDIHALNRLCDKHAAAHERSVFGQFPREAIRNAVASASTLGLIRRKTFKEIREDCAKIDAQLAKKPCNPKAPREYIGRSGYSLAMRKKIVAAVDEALADGTANTLTHACALAGTTVRSYRAWSPKSQKKREVNDG